jgi:hypothetical protein
MTESPCSKNVFSFNNHFHKTETHCELYPAFTVMYLGLRSTFSNSRPNLMEDGTISRISNAYSLRQGRRRPPTSEVEELQFVIVIEM